MKREIITTLALDGEKEFKKGLEDAQRQMRVLASESKSVTSAFGNNQGSLEALTAKNKLFTKQVEQQKEVVQALEKAVRDSAQMYGEADKKTDEWRIKLNNAQATLNKLHNELEDNEKQIKDATDAMQDMAKAEDAAADKAKGMGKDLKDVNKQTGGFKDQIKEFASSSIGQMASLAGAVAIAKEAFQALWNIIDDATNAADEILTLSEKTGIAVDTLQGMQYAARFVDVELDTMMGGLSKTVKAIKEANTSGKDYIDITDNITVSTKDQNGQLRDSQDIYYDVIDAIGGIANETEREIAAQKIFGKSYQDVMPLIKAGSSAIKKYSEDAKDAGITIDTVTVKALGKLDDTLEKVSATAEAQGAKMAAALAPVADTLSIALSEIKSAAVDAFTGTDRAINGLMLWGGLSRDAAEAQVQKAQQLANLAYVIGTSVDEAKTKVDELNQYLITQGVSANEAYGQALNYVADGMDAVGIAQQQMQEAQAQWDEQVNAALDSYIAKRAEYEAAVSKTQEAYLQDMGGLFEKFDASLAGSKRELDKLSQSLLDNLKSQVDGIQGWSDAMTQLAKRGISDGLLKELRDMGPDAYAKIQALNNMTDAQLAQYESLYKKRSEAARDAAKTALEPMAQDVANALKAAEDVIASKNDAMKTLGKNLAKGIGDGIDAETWYIEQSARDAVNAAVAAAKKAGIIHSPSKLTRDEVGKNLGKGVGYGFIDALNALTPDIERQLEQTVNNLSSIPVSKSNVIRMSDYRPSITVKIEGPIEIYNDDSYETVAEKLGRAIQSAAVANGGYNGLATIS